MAVMFIDRASESDLDDQTVAAGGSVTGQARIVFDDTGNLGDMIVALDCAIAVLVRAQE